VLGQQVIKDPGLYTGQIPGEPFYEKYSSKHGADKFYYTAPLQNIEPAYQYFTLGRGHRLNKDISSTGPINFVQPSNYVTLLRRSSTKPNIPSNLSVKSKNRYLNIKREPSKVQKLAGFFDNFQDPVNMNSLLSPRPISPNIQKRLNMTKYTAFR